MTTSWHLLVLFLSLRTVLRLSDPEDGTSDEPALPRGPEAAHPVGDRGRLGLWVSNVFTQWCCYMAVWTGQGHRCKQGSQVLVFLDRYLPFIDYLLWSTWSLHVYFSFLSFAFLAVNVTVEGLTPSVITCQCQRTSLLTHFGATLSLPKVNHLLWMHQEFLLMILQYSSMRFDECDPWSPPPPSSRQNIFPPSVPRVPSTSSHNTHSLLFVKRRNHTL